MIFPDRKPAQDRYSVLPTCVLGESQVTIASSSGEVNSCRSSNPMRQLRLQDVEVGPRDRVFRDSRMRALIGWLARFAATAGFLFSTPTRESGRPATSLAYSCCSFVLLTLRMVTARFHPSDWLVRVNETGVYMQYRSNVNYQLPAEDPSVVSCPSARSASARLENQQMRLSTDADGVPHDTPALI